MSLNKDEGGKEMDIVSDLFVEEGGANAEEEGVASGAKKREIIETSEELLMLTTTFNIELLRFWGLIFGSVLLITGTVVTNNFVEFPEGSGSFHPEKTFIYEIFHFNHTCTVLDFNPSKTISAMVIMFHTIPMDLFIFLSYYRMKNDYVTGLVPKWLWYYTKITTPFILTAFTYFYMVFVNSPSDMPSFTAHYIPYMCWQIAMIFMAIGQCAYLSEMDVIPFNIPKVVLKVYLVILVATGIYYTVFIWSFVAKHPILDTKIASNRKFAITLMYFFDVIAAIIPTIFAFKESRNGNTQSIHFFNTPDKIEDV